MRRLSRYRSLALIGAAAVVASGVAACGSSNSSGNGSSSSSGTLTMESSPESTITQEFNPFITTGAPLGMGATGLIYEPLIQFDVASPPKYYPWLATGYTWSNGGKTITFAIRQGVKWNNGKPLTAADVAFTYNMLKKYSAVNLGGLTMSSVSTSGNNVTLTFPTAQYTNLQQIAGVDIVPQSIFSKVNPATYTDATPVGSGPYMLSSFTPQGFTLKKNPDYWQASKVKVAKVYFPVYTSNTSALSALFSGAIDWTGNFIPGLQKDFVAKSPAYHHFWLPPGGDNSFEPNLTKWPTNQLPVRQAISLALNRSLLASEGEAGLEYPVTNATGEITPTYNSWTGPVASKTLPSTANVAAAKAVLEKAGYKLGSNGFFSLNGKEVSIAMIAPAAYTDYAEVGSLAAGQLKAAGINATFSGVSVNAWNADVADGNFQMLEHWSNGGITPFNMYNGWLNSALAKGSAATGDYEHLNDPALDTQLTKLAGDQSVSQQTTDLVPLEDYVAANLPVIPLTTASDWFEYNSQHFVGWPTQSNPYQSGQPSAGTDEVVMLHLSPR